jgi:hypothetical protein
MVFKGMVLAQMPCQIFSLKHFTYNPEDQMNTLTQLWKYKIIFSQTAQRHF